MSNLFTDEVFQWLHRLSHTYPLRQPFQRPDASPSILPLLTSFLRFLTASLSLMASLFLSDFPPACPADEAGTLLDRILWKTVTAWTLWTSWIPTRETLLRSARQLKMASPEQKVSAHMT